MKYASNVFKRLLKIVIFQILIIILVFCIAQIIPAQRTVTHQVEYSNELGKGNVYEDDLTTFIEDKGLIPFLTTYHLNAIYWILCADTILNIGVLIGGIVYEKKKI